MSRPGRVTPRGFSEGADDPRRDFMATYFDHDDDVTRGMVEDYLDRIEAAAARTDREQMAKAVERGEWDDVFHAVTLNVEVLAQCIYWVYGTADDARQVVAEYVRRTRGES